MDVGELLNGPHAGRQWRQTPGLNGLALRIGRRRLILRLLARLGLLCLLTLLRLLSLGATNGEKRA